MLKSTTNADCPYCIIQRYVLYLEFYLRAALIKIIKVIKKLIEGHDGFSFFSDTVKIKNPHYYYAPKA